MIKKLHFKKLLLMALMLVGAGSAFGQDTWSYTFGSKIFDANNQTQTLNDVDWTIVNDGDYYGYDATKGQQVGSGSKPAKAMTLSTSGIPGTITAVKVNTSGASGIAGTFAVSVGETDFTCDEETSVALTSTATAYEFTGSASGEIVLSWAQTSSKAFYVKSIEVTYQVSSIPTPQLSVANGAEVKKGTKVTITNLDDENYFYFYTTDGTTPTLDNIWDCELYEDGIEVNQEPMTIKVAATNYDMDELSRVASITVSYLREETGLALKDGYDEITMEVTETIDLSTVYTIADDYDGTVTYTSSNTSAATIDGSVLTALKKGSTLVTITVPQTDFYLAATKNIPVTITVKDPVAPVGPVETGTCELVTDASTLADGDQIILVGIAGEKVYAMGEQKTSNRGATDVELDTDGNIIPNSGMQVITLEGSTDAWYFCVGEDSYLYAASSTSNYLKTGSATDNAKATIAIGGEGTATILFQGTNSRNYMRFNPNNGSPLFACYAQNSTTGSEPKIYRYVPGQAAESFDVTIGSSGYKTLVSTADFETPNGVTAYIVTNSTTENITLTTIDKVKAGTPVILEGTPGNVTLTVVENAAAAEGNLLKVSTETTGNGVYVLAAPANKPVGFYKWTGGSLGAGRVYLDAPAAGSRDFLQFNFGETTGVADINREATTNNSYFDLQGRHVAQPTKGLYIVNGKKVIIK